MLLPFLSREQMEALGEVAVLIRARQAWEVYRQDEREIFGAMLGIDAG